MPKGRYGIMAPYMDKVGSYGRDMMFRTCTVQVNLDFASEADMVKKLRVSLALQPVATALFANSPFLEGKPNGFLSFRSEVWRDTDKARSGMLPFAFEDGLRLRALCRLCARRADVFRHARRQVHQHRGRKLPPVHGRQAAAACRARSPVMKDWADHLTTIFPEVRLKKYLEMRGADSGPWRRLCALAGAVWVGLLYDQSALDAAWDLVKDWTAEERQALRDAVPRAGAACEDPWTERSGHRPGRADARARRA